MDLVSQYYVEWLTLVTVFTLAVLSPGPDFVLAVKNSIVHSRRVGVFTAFGFGLSIACHATYTILGIAAFIAKSVWLFNGIKYAGAAYLIYIGLQAVRSKGMGQKAVDQALMRKTANVLPLTNMAALRSGFLTNFLNPKATLFFLSIFTQIVSSDTPVLCLVVYVATCSVLIVAWFSFVALVLNQRMVRAQFLKSAKWIDRVCGAFLVALGLKVAFSE